MQELKNLCVITSLVLLFSGIISLSAQNSRIEKDFGNNWKFHHGDAENAKDPSFDDSGWRTLNLPHDWSIEGKFSNDHPATPGGGALPGGIGWYRKKFTLPESNKNMMVFIDFDGIYQYSEVWINGNTLGIRPNGYISFRLDLTPYINFGSDENVQLTSCILTYGAI